MKKYYTRACNFFYGQRSKELIKKKLTLPLCGNNSISFNQIEIFIRDKKRIKSKIINIKRINKLNPSLKKKINEDIKKITSKRVFLKKRERTTHQPPQKTKTRASSRFLFFRRGAGGGSKRCLWHKQH